MLQAFRLAFQLPATDELSIQMRLDRINESASGFSSQPISNLTRREWHPVRPGFSVFDVGGLLAKGTRLVPYTGDDGDVQYLVGQESFLTAFNGMRVCVTCEM